MRKRFLSIILTICMVLTLLPTVTIPASAAETLVTNEIQLLNAINSVAEGGVVKLANDIVITSDSGTSIEYSHNYSFTLDLNGKKITKSGSSGIIQNNGSGTLTIDDTSPQKNGEIYAESNSATIIYGKGNITLKAGVVKSRGVDQGTAIWGLTGDNVMCGTVSIEGGSVYGMIEASYGGIINISGGTISASKFPAVFSHTYTTLPTTINISGGKISSGSTQDCCIEADSYSTINIKGAAVIQGGKGAMNKAPASTTAGLVVKASTNYDGTNPVSEYDPANISSYKYFESMVQPSSFNATIDAKKNGSAWTAVANDQIVLSTSATDSTTGKLTATPASGVFTFSNIATTTYHVWAKNKAGTYVKTGSVSFLNTSATVNYYDVNLTGGTGIASVTGDGTYLSGETAAISATLTDGYTWAKWSDNNTTMTNRSVTVSAKTDLTASATLTPATAPTVSVTGADLIYGYTSGSVSVIATPVAGHTITGYQWYSNSTNSNSSGTLISGATSASYTLGTGKAVGVTEYYYCVVTTKRTDSGQTATATSGVAAVTVGKADGSGSVSIDDWTYGGTASGPAPASTTNGTGSVTYSYEGTGSTSYAASATAPVNAGTYKVTATFATTADYKECTASDTFTIAKAPVSFAVSDNTHDYDTGAHTATVTQTASETPSISGNFTVTYQKDTEMATENETNVGVYKIIVKLNNDNFKFSGQDDTVRSLTLTDKLTIKAVAYPGAASITRPTAGSLTYGAKLSDSALTGGDSNCTYAWETGTTIPIVMNTGYAVVCTPKDINYSPFLRIVPIAVSKATPTLTLPTASAITYGQKLYNSTFTDGSASALYNGAANTNVPGAYSWSVDTTAPQVQDSNSTQYEVTFTPTDKYNYSTATGKVTLTVNPKSVALIWDYTTPFTYDGAAKTVTATVSNKIGEDAFVLAYSDNSKTNSGSYTAEVTALGNGNYTLTGAVNASMVWVIDKAPVSFAVSDNSYTYDATAHKATVAQTASQIPVIAADKYAVIYKLPADGSGAADKTAVGVYDAIVTLSDDNFCFADESDAATRSHKVGTLTIGQNTVTALWKNTTTVYDGTAKTPVFELVGLKDSDTSVKVQLKETKTNAGTYTVTAELSGANSGNYTLTNPSETFIIQKAPVSFTLNGNSVKKGDSVNVTATPSVAGVSAALSYWQNGKQVASPTETGSYDVYAEIADTNYRHAGGTDGSAQKIGVLTIYESSSPAAYTVSFDANGGTGDTASMNAVQAGTVHILPESGFTSTGKVFAGWQYNGKTYQPGACFTQPSSNVTLKALWNDKVYSIGGTVQEGDPVANATNVVVTLMLGSQQIGQTVTGADGKYSFADVVPGVYNLVANKDGVTQTIMVTIEDKAVTNQTITMPTGKLNSVVEVKAGSPAIVVGNLEKAFTQQDKTDAATKTVELKLTAEAKAADSANNAQQEIEKKAGGVDIFLDIKLTKTVDGNLNTLDGSPVLLTAVITLPAELQGKDSYTVYRYHGTEVQTLTTAANAEGEKIEVNKDKTTLTVYTKNFSAYAIKGVTYSGGSISSYKLTFEVNGGSTITALSITEGTTVNLSAYKPAREGYTFAGWYSDAKLTTAITSVRLTANTTVYAKWTVKGAMPFTDVPADVYYYDAILWAVEKGITNGTSATTFSPDMTCTRAQTVTFLWRAMGSPEPTTPSCPFTDVAKDAYYYKAVLWATEKGITIGTSSTAFSPDTTVTRGQTVTFLWRTAGKSAATTTNPFSDVSTDDYYANAVLWAVSKGITTGTSNATFSPADGCTRAQIVTFLYRYLAK